MASCPVGVIFDGTNDGMSRGADLTGSADNAQGTVFFWFQLNGGDAANQDFFRTPAGNFSIRRNSANKFATQAFNPAFTNGQTITTTATYVASSGWHSYLSSWDNNFASPNKLRHIYIDDVSDLASGGQSGAADVVDYTDTNWYVGWNGSGNRINSDMSDLWFAEGVYFDFSTVSNRRKFISASGGAVDLGASGELPTGSSPIVFQRGPASAFATNLGTGGNFTVTGALTDSSTNPPCSQNTVGAGLTQGNLLERWSLTA